MVALAVLTEPIVAPGVRGVLTPFPSLGVPAFPFPLPLPFAPELPTEASGALNRARLLARSGESPGRGVELDPDGVRAEGRVWGVEMGCGGRDAAAVDMLSGLIYGRVQDEGPGQAGTQAC